MVSRISAAAAMGLAALASAAPVAQFSDPAPVGAYFSLILQAEGYPNMTLHLAHVAAGQSQAIFEDPSSLDDYSMYFDEVGDNYGTTTPVFAGVGTTSGRAGFTASNGEISAKLDPAEEHFFACNTTVDSEPAFGLFWGIYPANGYDPDDCVTANLVQDFDAYAEPSNWIASMSNWTI